MEIPQNPHIGSSQFESLDSITNEDLDAALAGLDKVGEVQIDEAVLNLSEVQSSELSDAEMQAALTELVGAPEAKALLKVADHPPKGSSKPIDSRLQNKYDAAGDQEKKIIEHLSSALLPDMEAGPCPTGVDPFSVDADFQKWVDGDNPEFFDNYAEAWARDEGVERESSITIELDSDDDPLLELQGLSAPEVEGSKAEQKGSVVNKNEGVKETQTPKKSSSKKALGGLLFLAKLPFKAGKAVFYSVPKVVITGLYHAICEAFTEKEASSIQEVGVPVRMTPMGPPTEAWESVDPSPVIKEGAKGVFLAGKPAKNIDGFTSGLAKLEKGEYYPRASQEESRQEVQQMLGALGRKPIEGQTVLLQPNVPGGKKKAWELTELDQLGADDKLVIGGDGRDPAFELTGAEVQGFIDSTKVRYLDDGMDPHALAQVLTHGSTPAQRKEVNAGNKPIVRKRCVGQDVAFFRNSKGEPLARQAGEPFPSSCRMYNMSAPNLNYNKADQEAFVEGIGTPSQKLKADAYKQECKDNMKLYLESCQADGVDVPVVPGFGLSSFMIPDLKNEALELFGEALAEVLSEGDYDFDQVIFQSEEGEVFQKGFEKAEVTPSISLVTSNASSMDIVELGSQNGMKMGVLNAGDPSCVAGQFWEGGHTALEEVFGMASTMILQHPGAAGDKLTNAENYEPIAASAGYHLAD